MRKQLNFVKTVNILWCFQFQKGSLARTLVNKFGTNDSTLVISSDSRFFPIKVRKITDLSIVDCPGISWSQQRKKIENFNFQMEMVNRSKVFDGVHSLPYVFKVA